jgi:hypothetical protein
MEKIPDSIGTAANVQAMVFGNLGETSGTGVGFTRDPGNGDKVFYGEFLINAQGEDVVAGIRTPSPIAELEHVMPAVYQQLFETTQKLEQQYRDMQDFEFTIEEGKLYMLQTRNGKRTGPAAVKLAVDMCEEGLIAKEEAVLRVAPNQLDQLLHPVFDAATLKEVWRFQSKGGKQNVNNVSSPAIAGKWLHFGTTAGIYYVLDRDSGAVVAEIDCGEPIFSTPVVAKDRVYVATLGAQVLAMTFEGKQLWKWDFVKEVVGFDGNRWSGESWAAWVRRFGRRLADEQGDRMVVLAGNAIRGVALGVVVTALVQSALGGIGLAIAGVPFAGVLTAIMFALCIAQIGPILVLLGATAGIRCGRSCASPSVMAGPRSWRWWNWASGPCSEQDARGWHAPAAQPPNTRSWNTRSHRAHVSPSPPLPSDP